MSDVMHLSLDEQERALLNDLLIEKRAQLKRLAGYEGYAGDMLQQPALHALGALLVRLADTPPAPAGSARHHTETADGLVDPRTVTLVYRDADGTDYEQVLADVPRDGTLIDPCTGDDLEWVLAFVDPAPAAPDFRRRHPSPKVWIH